MNTQEKMAEVVDKNADKIRIIENEDEGLFHVELKNWDKWISVSQQCDKDEAYENAYAILAWHNIQSIIEEDE